MRLHLLTFQAENDEKRAELASGAEDRLSQQKQDDLLALSKKTRIPLFGEVAALERELRDLERQTQQALTTLGRQAQF